ncbi:MAG: hypothetical protein AABY22_17655 [Nanoarchaeota archaeon]
MKNASHESIEADAKMVAFKDVSILRGVNREGIEWVVVITDDFAEFRCDKILVEFIPVEDLPSIIGMISHIDICDIRQAIQNIIW